MPSCDDGGGGSVVRTHCDLLFRVIGCVGRPDLLEAACDLLWSLAFNNALVKVGSQTEKDEQTELLWAIWIHIVGYMCLPNPLVFGRA
jgi:hypothetical protein